jgi:site-specific recombinase XerD
MSVETRCKAHPNQKLKDGSCPICGGIQPIYYVRYRPDGRDGRQEYISLGDLQSIDEARDLDAYYRAGVQEARSPRQSKVSLAASTIEDLTPDYLKWVHLNQRPQTFREREYTMRYINKIVGNIPVLGFGDQHITLYQKRRKAQNVSNKTVNKELYYLMAFFKWCREEQNMAVRDVKMKKLPYKRPLPVVLSPGEVSRILEVCSPFYLAFFACLYTIGLRFSEAQGLKWKDIDFENASIRCEQKGGSWKILPMSNFLASALSEIMPRDDDNQESSKPIPKRERFVFISKRTGRPIVNVRRAIQKVCEKAGIEKHVNPHLFRHSVATALMASGENLRIVQAMLGHADIGTTEFYTHVAMGHLRGAEHIISEGLKRSGSPQVIGGKS